MDKTVEKLYNDTETSACFFRSTVREPNRKCLIQITEKCNFRCKHCFLSANETGDQISLDRIKKTVIPFCVNNRINKITLTGGESLVHPDSVAIINSFIESEIQVTVCTNGSLISDGFLKKIVDLSKVTFNVSMDAFSQKSFDLFRVNEMQSSLKKIISNIQLLGKLNILKGILVTPNIYVSIEEYYELCQFAKKCGAKYVLMNPLSEFGRGSDKNSLGYTKEKLIELREKTNRLMDDSFEMVYIRFPNNGKKLSQCKYGKVLYLFTDGGVMNLQSSLWQMEDRLARSTNYWIMQADNVELFAPSLIGICTWLDEHPEIDINPIELEAAQCIVFAEERREELE